MIFATLFTCLMILLFQQVKATTLDYLTDSGDLFQQVLTAAKLAPEEVRFDRSDMGLWGGDKYQFKLLDVFFNNPWKISPYTRVISQNFLDYKSDLAAIAYNAYKISDTAGLSPQLNPDLLQKFQQQVKKLDDNALAVSLSQLTGKPANFWQNSAYQNLPPQLRSAIAQFLFAVSDAMHYRDLALQLVLKKLQLDPESTYKDVVNYAISTVEENADALDKAHPERVLLIESLLDNLNFPLLNTGGIIAVSAAQELQQQLSKLPISVLASDYDFNLNTPLGRIVLRGKGNQAYPADDYLLIVDASGDDTYFGGAANRNMAHGMSLLLDLSGNDHYSHVSGKIPSWGAGVFGYGILMDLQGDDQYSAAYASQGVGIFGTGILYDALGKDSYMGIGDLQGSGIFGTGILIDHQGSDRYALYQYGQGYGFTKGVGLLLDTSGDDRYIGLEDKYPNGGPFGPNRHVHFAQGAGFGRRGEEIDGHNWAGGVGMLVDGAGNDHYEGDVFSQGTAYWYSLGFLVDKSGDDYHRTGVYSLGSAPHFAVGIYQDDAGSDRYKVRISQSLGKGRDWSIGWFEDSAGNDYYQGHHGNLGSADANGIGVFWDKKGNDTYISFADLFNEEASYGQSKVDATGLRELMLTLGLFVDGGGKDNYLIVPKGYKQGKSLDEDINPQILIANTAVGNNKIWCRPTIPHNVKKAYGCGIDADSKLGSREQERRKF